MQPILKTNKGNKFNSRLGYASVVGGQTPTTALLNSTHLKQHQQGLK
jgi:hypothetical protein